jgi:hypothetical protein
VNIKGSQSHSVAGLRQWRSNYGFTFAAQGATPDTSLHEAFMCELLAMSANVPTDVRFSFAALSQRGGATGSHTDGWGISFYEQKGCRSLHDPNPSAHSELAKFIRSYPIKSLMVIAHVRKANRGRVAPMGA